MATEFNVADLREVLRSCLEYEPNHHLGRPFMSAYQIAIRFAAGFPNHPSVRQLQIGGANTGEYQSLAQRIARFLSVTLRDEGAVIGIEGGFISHDRVGNLHFQGIDGAVIQVSTLRSEHGHAIFRYVDTTTAS